MVRDRRGRIVGRLRHQRAVTGLAVAPAGARVATGTTDGEVKIWDVASQRPLCRAPLLLTPPRRLLTARGTVDLVTGARSELARLPPWQRVVATEGRIAARRGRLLCMATWDDRLVALDTADGRRIFSRPHTPATRVHVTGGACVALSGRRLLRVDKAGRELVLSRSARAVESTGEQLLVAEVKKLRLLDRAGREVRSWTFFEHVSASYRLGDVLIVGYQGGLVTKVMLTADGARETLRLADTPHGWVTRIIAGPKGTVVAGYRDGTVAAWNLGSGQRLLSTRLHGAVVHLAYTDHKLYAATLMGDHRVLDLSAYTMERCELLRQIWQRVPRTWTERGELVRSAPPADHPCRRR